MPEELLANPDEHERLLRFYPLQGGSLHGEPIIMNKDGWPFELTTIEDMQALVVVVNQALRDYVTVKAALASGHIT